MQNFLAVFLGTAEKMQKWEGIPEAERKEREKKGMEAWMAWGEKYKDAIVENGAPLGKTKKIDENGVTDIKNEMAAYTVVKAASHEEAAKMFVNHPHFSVFPGDRVEVMPCLPIPKMPE